MKINIFLFFWGGGWREALNILNFQGTVKNPRKIGANKISLKFEGATILLDLMVGKFQKEYDFSWIMHNFSNYCG